MKLSSVSKFSMDFFAEDSHQRSCGTPLSPSVYSPGFKTAETEAGQEIQSILHKGSRAPNAMTCAAPLPMRSPPPVMEAEEVSENEDEDDDFFPCRPFPAGPRRWFAASPTRLADGPTFEAGTAWRPIPKGPCAAEPAVDMPTLIVGTPPCRAGNPMVNDTQFMTRKTDAYAECRRTSGFGCELGLFRLSPPAF
eukprot:EG_transcript_27275